MIITHNDQRMTIRSLEQAKLFASSIAVAIGSSMAIYNRPFNLVLLIFSVIFMIVGILLGLDIVYIKVVLNKSNKSSVTTRRGRRTETTAFALDDVKYIEKLEYVIGGGWRGPTDALRLGVRGHDFFEIAETSQNRLLMRLIPTLRPYRRQGEKIAQFVSKEYRLKRVNPFKAFTKSLGRVDPKA